MEKKIHDTAHLFIANGYGFGKYWAGHIFAKTTKDKYFQQNRIPNNDKNAYHGRPVWRVGA